MIPTSGGGTKPSEDFLNSQKSIYMFPSSPPPMFCCVSWKDNANVIEETITSDNSTFGDRVIVYSFPPLLFSVVDRRVAFVLSSSWLAWYSGSAFGGACINNFTFYFFFFFGSGVWIRGWRVCMKCRFIFFSFPFVWIRE